MKLSKLSLWVVLNLFILGVANADAPKGYKLVWSDEFTPTVNHKLGQPTPVPGAPDSLKWDYTLKKDNQDELQTYTTSTQNASVVKDKEALDGYALKIQAIKDKKGTLTSARLATKDKYSFQYGYVECRAKLPYGQGMWPAFWMLGTDIDKVSWPACGEVDIMEAIGKDPGINYGSIHGPGYIGGKLGDKYTLPNGELYKDAYHTFAIEWTPKRVKFFMDDKLYANFTPKDLPPDSTWAFEHPFYLILQLALGGSWGENPDDTTVFPQSLMVDYVHVYQK